MQSADRLGRASAYTDAQHQMNDVSDMMQGASVDATTSRTAVGNCQTSEEKRVCLVLFTTHDLRVTDHGALWEATKNDAFDIVLPCFLWSNPQHEADSIGYSLRAQASEVWIREALKDLDKSLRSRGSRLVMRRRTKGPLGIAGALASLVADMESVKSATVFTGTCFEPAARDSSHVWHKALSQSYGIRVKEFNTSLLYDTRGFNNSDSRGNNMRIHWGTLMHFIGLTRQLPSPPRPRGTPTSLRAPEVWPESLSVDALLQLPPSTRLWDRKITESWSIAESSALELHERFIAVGLPNYEKSRNRADIKGAVSRLSPYIRHGQISPRTIYWAVVDSHLPKHITKTFGRRLFWRDLAYFQLDQFPQMHSVGIRVHYDQTVWRVNKEHLEAWKFGRTGFPQCDAAMRELYATGYIQQNVRMVVASFLVEYLGMDWRHGLRWFHECLVDADLAINSMMWQNAGRSGIDQWNMILRPDSGMSRDPQGIYVRKWVPEIKELPTKYIFAPWTAPPEVLRRAGVSLGNTAASTYPERIIKNLQQCRQESSAAVLKMRRSNLHFNDNRGYDIIALPSGAKTKVFTKKEFRLDKHGNLIRQPAKPKARPKRSGQATAAPPSGQRHKRTKRRAKHDAHKSKGNTGKVQTSLSSFFCNPAIANAGE